MVEEIGCEVGERLREEEERKEDQPAPRKGEAAAKGLTDDPAHPRLNARETCSLGSKLGSSSVRLAMGARRVSRCF